ncbi:MAG: M81 family metallopeptidase [Rhizomicrobium sp.]
MRVYCVHMSHETSAVSPIPTSLASYRDSFLYLPSTGEGADAMLRFKDSNMLGAVAARRGHDVVVGLAAVAQPSRPTPAEDYRLLREEIASNLKAAMPVDMVVMFLHGAQVAEGCDDCEGEVLEDVRAMVGSGVPIGVEIDLHGNVTARMIANADVIVACKEYPHVDFGLRAVDLMVLMEKTVRHECKPAMAFARVPMFGSFPTTLQPMRSFVDEIMTMEGKDGILSISVGHGFPWADTPDAGGTVIVVTDDDMAKAQRLADDLAQRLFAMRRDIWAPRMSIDAALSRALKNTGRPTVLADMIDNPGGGAPGDATHILRAMLERGVTDAAIAMIWDPVAVQMAFDAGIGRRIPLRIGGKVSALGGDPVDLDATIVALAERAMQSELGPAVNFGPAAAIEAAGIQIVLSTRRRQTFTSECFTALGIDPLRKKLLVVKSQQHFHEHFAKFAAEIVYVDSPGCTGLDFGGLPFKRISRPVWPIDATPFEAHGRRWE